MLIGPPGPPDAFHRSIWRDGYAERIFLVIYPPNIVPDDSDVDHLLNLPNLREISYFSQGYGTFDFSQLRRIQKLDSVFIARQTVPPEDFAKLEGNFPEIPWSYQLAD